MVYGYQSDDLVKAVFPKPIDCSSCPCCYYYKGVFFNIYKCKLSNVIIETPLAPPPDWCLLEEEK